MVVIEGVLMYLPPSDVDRVFQALHSLPAQRLRIVFSAMERWSDGSSGFRPYSWLIERWLMWRQEPFNWAIEPHAIQGYLTGHQFQMTELVPARQLSGLSLASLVSLEGENLVTCEPLRACAGQV